MPSYDSLRPHIDTGDIVLFSGKGGVSAGIKWLTRSDWSHVGMALRPADPDVILLWESALLNDAEEAETGQISGVQLTPLRRRIAGYDGDIAIRNLEVERTPAMYEALNGLRQEVKGRPYEKSRLQLLRSAYDGPFGNNHEDLSSLFCSELIAEAYQRMGLLPETPHASEYTPRDFSDAGGLVLLKGRLGPERAIRHLSSIRL